MALSLEEELVLLIKTVKNLSIKHNKRWYIVKCDCGSLDVTDNPTKEQLKRIVYDTKNKIINRKNL